MDDLLREFVTEAGERLDAAERQLVRFAREPKDIHVLGPICDVLHKITCNGRFFGLQRLEALAHTAATLLDRFRHGMPVTDEAVTLILVTIDRINDVVKELQTAFNIPDGSDADLIDGLNSVIGAASATAVTEDVNSSADVDGLLLSVAEAGATPPQRPDALTMQSAEQDRATTSVDVAETLTPLLIFRAGPAQPMAVPLSSIARLDNIAVAAIEHADGRTVIAYRDQQVPLIPLDGVTFATAGVQPVLLLAAEDRVIGLAVDEIIDIVDVRFSIESGNKRGDCLGSVVVAGRAIDVVDLSRYLPKAAGDCAVPSETPSQPRTPALLLVDDSVFFRNLLAPVLAAAGYHVEVAANAQDGLTILRSRQDIEAVVTDIDMPDMDGFEFARTIRADTRLVDLPIIALADTASPSLTERGRQAGIGDHIAKFDRAGLVAMLKDKRIGQAA